MSKIIVTKHNSVFQMKMKKYYHFIVTRLEERILNIVIQDVDFVSAHRGVSETIDVSLQRPRHSFRNYIRPNVQIFQFGVSFIDGHHQSVLLDQIFLFPLFSFAGFEFLLDFFDQSETCVQIRRRRWKFTWLFRVSATISPETKNSIKFRTIISKKYWTYTSLTKVASGWVYEPPSFLPMVAPGWKKFIRRYV